MNTDKIKEQLDLPSDFKFPFQKNCLEAINISLGKKLLIDGGDFEWRGSIDFKNGNTKGIQNFKSNDFRDIVKQMEIFLNNLTSDLK